MRTAVLFACLAGCSFSGAPVGGTDAGDEPDAPPSAIDATPVPLVERLGAASGAEVGSAAIATDVDAVTVDFAAVPGPSLFVAAVASKPYRTAQTVSGLGLSWTELGSQCGAREQSGVSLWFARGPATNQDSVTLNLISDAQTAVAIVAQYRASADQDVQALLQSNRDGGPCLQEPQDLFSDDETYDFSMPVTPGRPVVGFISLREHNHEVGTIEEVLEVHSGTGGGDSGLVLVEALAPSDPYQLQGVFDGLGNAPPNDLGNDWGAIVFQLF